MKVGLLKNNYPFTDFNKKPIGIAYDIWDEYAKNNGIKYELVLYENSKTMLDENLDVYLGPFSANLKRFEKFQISFPYYVSEISVFVHYSVFPLITFVCIILVIILCLISLYLSIINNTSIFDSVFHAIESFIDKTNAVMKPDKTSEKLFNFFWRVSSFLFTSVVIGLVISWIIKFEENKIITIENLRSKKVGYIKGDFFSDLINRNNLHGIEYKNNQELSNAFKSGDIDCVMEDENIFYNNFGSDYKHTKPLLVESYCFLFSPTFKKWDFDSFLLQIKENGIAKLKCSRYLSPDDSAYCEI